jgi:hypothetical protein
MKKNLFGEIPLLYYRITFALFFANLSKLKESITSPVNGACALP